MMEINYLLVGASAAAVILIFYFLYPAMFCSKEQNDLEYETKTLKIGDATMSAKIADTDEKRRIGLMNATSLPENEGMLFVFDYSADHSFWMKDTIIPLEILFLDENLKIVGIREMAPCKSASCPVYSPGEDVLYAIELNENFSERHGISAGQTVEIVG